MRRLITRRSPASVLLVLLVTGFTLSFDHFPADPDDTLERSPRGSPRRR